MMLVPAQHSGSYAGTLNLRGWGLKRLNDRLPLQGIRALPFELTSYAEQRYDTGWMAAAELGRPGGSAEAKGVMAQKSLLGCALGWCRRASSNSHGEVGPLSPVDGEVALTVPCGFLPMDVGVIS